MTFQHNLQPQALPRESESAGPSVLLMRALPGDGSDFSAQVDAALIEWSLQNGQIPVFDLEDDGFWVKLQTNHDCQSLARSMQSCLYTKTGRDYFIAYTRTSLAGDVILMQQVQLVASTARALKDRAPKKLEVSAGPCVVSSFRRAMNLGYCHTHAQPILRLKDQAIGGHELLARLRSSITGEVINTGSWIGHVIKSHDSIALAEFVINDAQLRLQNKAPGDHSYLSINLTGHDLASSQVKSALQSLGADVRGSIFIELTEWEDALAIPGIRRHTQYVRDLGYRLAIDDFGSGNSSVQVLRALPFDAIKLDMSLVNSEHDIDRSLIKLAIKEAKSRSMSVVAEGIESPEIAETMRSIGVEYGQGYFLDRVANGDCSIDGCKMDAKKTSDA